MKLKRSNKRHSLIIAGAVVVTLSISGVSYALTRPSEPVVSHTHTTVAVAPSESPKPTVKVSSQTVDNAAVVESTPEPSASPSSTPTPSPTPEFNLRSLSIAYIEQHSMTDACISMASNVTVWAITGTAWTQKVYDLIEQKQYGIQKNSDGSKVCIYWNTLDELKG